MNEGVSTASFYEYKAQYVQGGITPERIKEMLDDMYDKGEISDKHHEWGYKGLEAMFGYVLEAEVDVPF